MTSKSNPDKFIQESFDRFAKEFVPRRDCSGEFSHIENCQGCIDVIVEEESKLKSFLTQELNEAYRRGFRDGYGKGRVEAEETEMGIKEA
jgi:flagellar biosynthesis/type III secretory pathway protein FliH